MNETLRFVRRFDVTFRILKAMPDGCWLIDCDTPSPPFFETNCAEYVRVPTPESWMAEQTTPAQAARLQMIQPLLDCDDCMVDKSLRYRVAAETAQQYQTTTRRILCLYYRYLATGQLMQKRVKRDNKNSQIIAQAIRQHYFGAKRLSLKSAYEMMLLEDYVGPDGQLDSDAPTRALTLAQPCILAVALKVASPLTVTDPARATIPAPSVMSKEPPLTVTISFHGA